MFDDDEVNEMQNGDDTDNEMIMYCDYDYEKTWCIIDICMKMRRPGCRSDVDKF